MQAVVSTPLESQTTCYHRADAKLSMHIGSFLLNHLSRSFVALVEEIFVIH